MCAVLDSGKLPEILENKRDDYEPLINWIIKSGKIITGGTQYKEEVSKTPKYFKFLGELKRAGKNVEISDEVIDNRVENLKKIEPKSDFDDPHLVALVIESGCKIVCTSDKRAHKYIKDQRFYSVGKRPSIYYNASHSNLLCNNNLVGKCR